MRRARDRKYDTIFVGAGIICVLEAVYQSLCGKSVLVIDREPDMGGAWRSLEIFGLHDVENAIHYFLPDPHAFDFMRNVLTLEVVPSPRKYRVFRLPLAGHGRLPYDHPVSRFIGKLSEAPSGGMLDWLGSACGALKHVLAEKREPSRYVSGGAPEIVRKVKQILLASEVDVEYSTTIDRIHVDPATETVEVGAGARAFRSRSIFFSHGSRITNLSGPAGPISVEEKVLRRPAVHVLIRDVTAPVMYECIFTADPLIRYAHDVTRFARESAELAGRRKLLVLALHQDVTESESVYPAILEKLKQVRMVGCDAVMENHNWWVAYLPPLEDSDLDRLKAALGSQVEFFKTDENGAQVDYLKTENFSRGIGNHARKWATRISPPGTASGPARVPGPEPIKSPEADTTARTRSQ